LSRSYQAGQPEPTVGPAQPPGSIAGRCWVATDNSKNRMSETPALWCIADILHFCKLTFCQHAVAPEATAGLCHHSYESGDTAEALITEFTTGMVANPSHRLRVSDPNPKLERSQCVRTLKPCSLREPGTNFQVQATCAKFKKERSSYVGSVLNLCDVVRVKSPPAVLAI